MYVCLVPAAAPSEVVPEGQLSDAALRSNPFRQWPVSVAEYTDVAGVTEIRVELVCEGDSIRFLAKG